MTLDGEDTELWTITNDKGISMSLCNWGATIVSVHQPDVNSKSENIVLGHPNVRDYQQGSGYLGATCGRFANRIAKGKFSIGNKEYNLAINMEPNHLHGGVRGFDSRLWSSKAYAEGDCVGVSFSLVSKDGEEGYPGELMVNADYALDEGGRILMEFRAETSKTTIVNLTNHSYWNLSGVPEQTVHNIVLKLHAGHYLPVDDTGIPIGPPASVEGTAFDFRKAKPIGRDMGALKGGYDHCMIIDGEKGNLNIAAEAFDPQSGRKLTLYTDRPGLQFYTGNFLDGKPYAQHSAFCLEPQDFPNAPNRPDFPPVILEPGETYHHRSLIELTTAH